MLAKYPDDRDGMRFATAAIYGKSVLIGSIDSRIAAGTLALSHFADFVALLDVALERDLPVALFLDTAGVRLQDAAGGELGFRHALFAACAFMARGGKAITIVPGPMGCFGAGALLALCLGPVLMAPSARLAVAGPKALEAASSKEIFDAENRAMVEGLMGAATRLRNGLISGILNDNAASACLQIAQSFGSGALDLDVGVSTWIPDAYYALPDGQQVPLCDGVLYGSIELNGAKLEVLGVKPGTILTVERAATISSMLDPTRCEPLLLLCDAEQSLDPAEDARGLALAYANLARNVATCRLSGRAVLAYGATGGTGAAFMVLGMMADKIALQTDADCSAVPLEVAKALLGDNYGRASASATELFNIGGIEFLFDQATDRWSDAMSNLMARPPQKPKSFHDITVASTRNLRTLTLPSVSIDD